MQEQYDINKLGEELKAYTPTIGGDHTKINLISSFHTKIVRPNTDLLDYKKRCDNIPGYTDEDRKADALYQLALQQEVTKEEQKELNHLRNALAQILQRCEENKK